MKIKYLGPSPFVNVGGFGPHTKDAVKDYPEEIGEELIATAKRQKFEAVEGGAGTKSATPEEILEAARQAIEVGEVTSSGKPKVEAIEEILGKNISAADRDEAYEKIKDES